MLNASRRGFLRKTLGAAWSAGALLEQSVLRAAAARSQAPAAPAKLFTIEEMADGIWGAVAERTTFINCNAGIFEMSDGLLVMDSHSKPSAAAALVAQIRKEVSLKPVRYLVNSHFHWDHTQGNASYRKAGARLDIVASEATRRLMTEGAAERLKSALAGAQRSLEDAKAKLAAAQTAEEKARWQKTVSDTQSYLREMQSYTPELPNVTVRGDLTLHDKQQELRIVFRGRGHTEGDVCVWSPTRKVLATGDLAHGSLPYMGDGYPRDWPNTLTAVGMLEFDKFIGGHAGVQLGRQRMDQMRNYIEELTQAVLDGVRRGKPVDQLRKEITPTSLKSMGGGYGEAVAQPEALAAGVSNNVAQVFGALRRG